MSRSPNLDAEGREVPSNISLTVAAYYPTLGERIRRYMRTPTLQNDVYNNPELWDEDDAEVLFNEDGLIVSPHESRYQEGLVKAKELKIERDKAEKEAAVKREKEENEAFRNRVKQAMKDGSTTEPE